MSQPHSSSVEPGVSQRAWCLLECVGVWLWGQQVGTLRRLGSHHFHAFEYTPQWLASGPTLSPLVADEQRWLVVGDRLPWATYHGLPGFLADALPDEFGLRLIDARLEALGADVERITSLDRLALLGSGAMGALEFRSHLKPQSLSQSSSLSGPLDVASLVNASRVVSMGVPSDGVASVEDMDRLAQVGISAGGQRAKAVVAWNPDTGEVRADQGAGLPAGFSHWLLKLDGVLPMAKDGALELGPSLGWGRVEYAYFLMAREAGVAISECRLLEEQGRAHFLTRRFDRDGDEKIHQASLCGLSHLDYRLVATHEYDQLLDACVRLGLPASDLMEVFRRMAFNVLARNNDDHTKNFGFLLRPGQGWALAPAYDITYANNPASKWVSQHLMGVNGKFKDIARSDMLAVGARAGLDEVEMRRVLEQVASAIHRWPRFAHEAGVMSELRDEISAAHQGVALT